jgi:hypothetical protein
VNWESTLNTGTEANFTYCECFADSATMDADNYTLENLYTGAATLDNANMYLYIVASAKIRNVASK